MNEEVPRWHRYNTDLRGRVTTVDYPATYAIRFAKPEGDKQTKYEPNRQNQQIATPLDGLDFVLRNAHIPNIYALRKSEAAGCGALGCRNTHCIIQVHKSATEYRTLCPRHVAGWVSQ
jgi:hypothetical protein